MIARMLRRAAARCPSEAIADSLLMAAYLLTPTPPGRLDAGRVERIQDGRDRAGTPTWRTRP